VSVVVVAAVFQFPTASVVVLAVLVAIVSSKVLAISVDPICLLSLFPSN